MNEDNNNHKLTKKTVIIASIIIATLLIAFTTIIILKNVTQKTTKTSTVKIIKSPENIIKAYSKDGAIISLSSKKYASQTNTSSLINYKLSGKKYETNILTKDSILYYGNKESLSTDFTDIQSQTLNFMTNAGLTKTDSPAAADINFKYLTFIGSDSVCQLASYVPATNSGVFPYYQLSCVSIATIEKEYSNIENLLTIYKKTQTIANFTKATEYTNSSDKISYSIIYLTDGAKSYQLLFAAIDNDWSYIGDLMAGDEKYSNGKYNVTPEIETKISDPKYNGFLVKEIH